MSKTLNPSEETLEHERLRRVRGRIRSDLQENSERLQSAYEEVRRAKQYLQAGRGSMDHVEKITERHSIDQLTRGGEQRLVKQLAMSRLYDSPYFGRVDFQSDGGPQQEMYTGLHIQDDVLQEELGRATDEKMRNIVSTIQRDQNAVIRNDDAHTLVLQGAAGSGKTSIALHRIAYLLYTHRDEIDSSQVLILSPNRVFAHYISDVLPELGEEMIKETTMEELADYVLRYQVKFQTFAEQVEQLTRSDDPGFEARIRYKSTEDFVTQLEEYAEQIKAANVVAEDVEVAFATRSHIVPAAEIATYFHHNEGQPFNTRSTAVVRGVEDHLRRHTGLELDGDRRTEVRKQVASMMRRVNVRSLYREFYLWAAASDMFKTGKEARWEYADVAPLIYFGFLLEGCKPHDSIRHLVVDEMQDYSPVCYRVLERLFPCRKTILGDIRQSVNPYAASSAAAICQAMPRAETVILNKTYRSTLEITRFTLSILPNPDLEPVERVGDAPRVIACERLRDELETVKAEVRAFLDADHSTLGIVCRTQDQAETFAAGLKEFGERVHLINHESTHFHPGVVIASAHYAKGLEFDRVVVPFCTEHNYRTEMDRHLLYVACTRAMHRLTLTHTGAASPFLPKESY